MLDANVMTTYHLSKSLLGTPGSVDLKYYLDAFYKSFKDKNIDITEDRFGVSTGVGLIAHAIYNYGNGTVSLEEAKNVLCECLDCIYLLSNIIDCKYVHYVDMDMLKNTLNKITRVDKYSIALDAPLMYTPFDLRHEPVSYSEQTALQLLGVFYNLTETLNYTSVHIVKAIEAGISLPYYRTLSHDFKMDSRTGGIKYFIKTGTYNSSSIMVVGDMLIDALGFGINKLAYELEIQAKD